MSMFSGEHTPAPTAAMALSAPPAMTGIPTLRPVSRALSFVTEPTISLDSTMVGSNSGSIASADNISEDQRLFATSNNNVPEASDGSEAISPVNRNLM